MKKLIHGIATLLLVAFGSFGVFNLVYVPSPVEPVVITKIKYVEKTVEKAPPPVTKPTKLTPEDLLKTVVKIETGFSLGSGVIIKMDDTNYGSCTLTVLTAAHVAGFVVSDGIAPSVLPNPEIQVDGVQISKNKLAKNADLAKLSVDWPTRCDKSGYTAANIGAEAPTSGDRVEHVGYPGGELIYATASFTTNSPWKGHIYGVTTMLGGPGSSGGPVFFKSKLVGIIVRGENNAPPFRSIYEPISYAEEL